MTRLGLLWRSMPLRLALLLVLLFTTVSLLSLAASYAVTQSSFEQAIRADLRQDMAGFRAAPNARAVALLVEAESKEADPNRLILSYVSPSGRIFGNGAISRNAAGFHITSLDRDRAQYEGAYLSLTERRSAPPSMTSQAAIWPPACKSARAGRTICGRWGAS